jgi:hypothetical protein
MRASGKGTVAYLGDAERERLLGPVYGWVVPSCRVRAVSTRSFGTPVRQGCAFDDTSFNSGSPRMRCPGLRHRDGLD